MIRLVWQKLNKASNSNLYRLLRFIVRIIIIPLSYLLWFFEPFIKIRIYRGEISRIGHLAVYFEILIRSKEVDLLNKKQLNIFIVPNNPANITIYNMWKKHLNFIVSNKLDFIYHLCAPWFRNRSRHFRALKVVQGGLSIEEPTLKFTEQDIKKGAYLAKEIGINSDDWFVCLHSRSSAYLTNKFNKKNYDYHNLRDSSFEMLGASAKLIKEKGGKSIRMSNGDDQKLSKNLCENIIDYSSIAHNDFMDIYLPSKCKFFLGGPSGLLSVAHLFNVPVANTNIWPVNVVSIPNNSLFIPKLMWSIEEKRFLSYKEISEDNLDGLLYYKDYLAGGIEIIENDSDDIKLLTEDMFDLVNNNQLSSKDETKRNDFMNKYFTVNRYTNEYDNYNGLKFSGKISWRFLNKHSYLMNE